MAFLTRFCSRGVPEPTSRRVALYSHDTQGLGHIRRQLGIASALSAAGAAGDLLLLSGAREACGFPLPPRADCVTLPSLHKEATGSYRPRLLTIPLREVVGLRRQLITSAVAAFQPDVLIVDKMAAGAFGELEPALGLLAQRPGARAVLGLRDVLDDPLTVRKEWRDDDTASAVRTYYDGVWIYGDPTVYDPVTEYGFPASMAAKVRFTGYLASAPSGSPVPACCPSHPWHPMPHDLCLVGGGQDGWRLAAAFLEAEHLPGVAAVVVTGPYMPPDERAALEVLSAVGPHRHVLRFVDCLPLIQAARAVVAMGGYNTTIEVVAARRPALIVPRVRPRREQLIRAERLAGLGLLDVCHPDSLTPARLSAWLAAPRPPAEPPIDLGGRARLPSLLDDLFARRHRERILHAVG